MTAPNGTPTAARGTALRRFRSAVKESARRAIATVFRVALAPLPAGVKVVLHEQLALTERLDYAREPETVAWIERELGAGDVLFDVGANVGAYSLVAAKATGGAARVFAFEPAFATFAALCRNVALNACEGVIVPLPLALSDETTLGEFAYADLASGASLHAYAGHVHPRIGEFRPVLRQPVLSYRVDDLVRLWSIPVPALVKVDVDGAELAVLRGAGETLRDARVRSLLVEIEPESKDRPAIESLLADRGFLPRRDMRPGPNTIFDRCAGARG